MNHRLVIDGADATSDLAVRGDRRRTAMPRKASTDATAWTQAVIIATACVCVLAAVLPACESSRRGTATIDRRESTALEADLGDRSASVSDLEPPTLDRPTPSRTLSTWLEIEIAGGRTWLNLDRVESITVPSTLNPVGRLPILIVHYGSGRKVELAFDDDDQRSQALRRIEAALTIAQEPR